VTDDELLRAVDAEHASILAAPAWLVCRLADETDPALAGEQLRTRLRGARGRQRDDDVTKGDPPMQPDDETPQTAGAEDGRESSWGELDRPWAGAPTKWNGRPATPDSPEREERD